MTWKPWRWAGKHPATVSSGEESHLPTLYAGVTASRLEIHVGVHCPVLHVINIIPLEVLQAHRHLRVVLCHEMIISVSVCHVE